MSLPGGPGGGGRGGGGWGSWFQHHTRQAAIGLGILIAVLWWADNSIGDLALAARAFNAAMRWIQFIIIAGAIIGGAYALIHFAMGNHDHGKRHGKGALIALIAALVGPFLLIAFINLVVNGILPRFPAQVTTFSIPTPPSMIPGGPVPAAPAAPQPAPTR